MSFMVVNSGRAASRAFYLNLKAQPDVVAFSRHQLDGIVTRFIADGAPGPLEGLGASLRAAATIRGEDPTIGLVFHGVRPRLAHPFEDIRNTRFLEELRDSVGIDQVFFPHRRPEDVLLSEINRRLAETMGDWVFRDGVLGWRNLFHPADVAALRTMPLMPPPNVDGSIDVDHRALALDISGRTGKAHSLYRLFADVFPEVHVIEYDHFVARPLDVFSDMAQVAGFDFAHRHLVDVKLNGLANRFLVYNPVVIQMSRPVRFRFEIADVIELCDDWGVYQSLDVECRGLDQIADDVGAPIGLGVNVVDDIQLTPAERASIRQPAFLESLVATIGPVFLHNYRFMNDVYRTHVYLSEPPAEALEVFHAMNGEESAAMAAVTSGTC